ncbi:MAG TPA: hypothetical protein VNG13_09555 [Mycobacteriales bacterium]|nr:hypothetical protein [Mycobacteriales bacterium]
MTGYAAFLRVYEPLAALPEDERRYWAAYAADGRAPDRAAGMAREHAAALAAAAGSPVRLPPASLDDEAFVVVQDGLTFVCPWRTRLRAWVALEEFRHQLPEELADAFVPRPVVEAAEADQADWQARHPQAKPGILTSTWRVPTAWLVLFEGAERQLALGESPGGSGRQAPTDTGRTLVYRTAMSRARQRVARALHVLQRAFGDGAAASGVEDIGRWLEEFHPHALVELDYGGLVHLLDDARLSGDDSVAQISESLARLARGDAVGAARLYERVIARWRELAILENAN